MAPEDLAVLATRVAFGIAGFGAGVQLAREARATGGFPVQAWGSATIFVGGLGMAGFVVAPLLTPISPGGAAFGLGLADALERVALIGLALFVWRVFGAGSSLRRVVLVAIVGALLVDWISLLRFQAWPDLTLPVRVAVASHLCFALPLGWSAVETALQFVRARRQMALGLIDPVTVDRFRLWAIGSGCLTTICVLAAIEAMLGATAPALLVWVRALLHLVAALFVVLGFFPPRVYLEAVTRRAA